MSAQKNWVPHQKGNAFAIWGWNRASYSNCDLSIKGADYDLTFYNISAHDRPTEVSYYNYLKIDRITIPQTNFRVGYFVKDNFSISIGVDHMKYVMDQDQVVRAKGYINRKSIYQGSYDGNIKMNEDFLTFEHTDGLNYINAEVEKYNGIYQSKNNNLYFGYILGLGTGVLFPKTNVKFLDYERNDRFHFSGFGISAKAAIEAYDELSAKSLFDAYQAGFTIHVLWGYGDYLDSLLCI